MAKITNLDDIVKRREERERKEFQDKINAGISEMLNKLKKKREIEKKNKPLSKKLIILFWKSFGISLLIFAIIFYHQIFQLSPR